MRVLQFFEEATPKQTRQHPDREEEAWLAGHPAVESNRILGVSSAQWRQVDLPAQLQTTRLDAEGADRCCFGIEQSIFAALHTPNFRLLSMS